MIEYKTDSHSRICEHFLQSQYQTAEQADGISELFDFLKRTNACPVQFRLFVRNSCVDSIKAKYQKQFDELACPVLWISQPDKPSIPALSFQVHAISGADIKTIATNGHSSGCTFQDDFAKYFFINVLAEPGLNEPDSAAYVFDKMQDTLQSEGIDFAHTLRTWLFADRILDWYGKLNLARDAFFRKHGIFGKLVPASTGIGAANPSGSHLTTELLAVLPLNGSVRIKKVDSPMQCEALDYKSSFSRAVLMQTRDHSRMYVSGTASITPDGKTAHLDDCPAQVELTMQVVQALIENGHMDWSNSMQAIAYFKDASDFHLFDEYCKKAGLNIPHVKLEADVCRHDLLFELELYLAKPMQPICD